MKKRLIAMIAVITMAAGVFTSCSGQPDASGASSQSGKVYALQQDFAGSTGQGILAPQVNSKGQLVVASQANNAPVVLTTYGTDGKQVSSVKTDINDGATNFALDAKDTAYILAGSNIDILDASGKTTAQVPVGDILSQQGAQMITKSGSAAQASGNQQSAPQPSQASNDVKVNTGSVAVQPSPAGGQQAAGQPGNQNAAPKLAGPGLLGFAASSDGSIFLSVMGSGVIQIDKTGKQVRTLNSGAMNLICMNEKEQLMVYSSGQGSSSLTTYDTQSGSQVAKQDAAINPSMLFYDKQGKRVLFMSSDGIYPARADGTSGDAMITLSNFSLSSSSHSFVGFAIDGAGAVYIASSDGQGGMRMVAKSGSTGAVFSSGATANHLDRLALVDASTIPQKKTLTVAGLSDNAAVDAAIDAFQKAHPDYQVNLKTYSSQIVGAKMQNAGSGQQVDLTSLIQQFNTDVIANNTADIYILDGLPYYKYIQNGMLADIGQMMTQDNLDMSQYYSNIFDACKVNGKLYTLPTEFTYSQLAGKPSNIPASDTPSMDDFFKSAGAIPAGLAALPKQDATQAFESFMKQDYSHYVDQNAKTAKFNSPEFINLLNQFKALADSKMGSKSLQDQNNYEQVGDGALAFTNVNINTMNDMAMVRALAGDDVKFENMPSVDPTSYNFAVNGMYGINASSKNQQMAWEFLKTLLSPDIQGSMQMGNGIPVTKAAVQKIISQLTDSKKTSVAMIKTPDKQVEVKPLSAQEYAAMTDTFGKLNRLSAPDQNVVNILNEELPAFFSGQKSAQDVASLIQNRVMTILNE